jgi:hypothetical protein
MWMALSIDTTILRIASSSISRLSHSIITASAKMWSVQASLRGQGLPGCGKTIRALTIFWPRSKKTVAGLTVRTPLAVSWSPAMQGIFGRSLICPSKTGHNPNLSALHSRLAPPLVPQTPAPQYVSRACVPSHATHGIPLTGSSAPSPQAGDTVLVRSTRVVLAVFLRC